MQDKQLIMGIKNRDEKAFNELYQKYHNLVFYVVIDIVKSREDAAEITEDVFLKMYQKIDQLKTDNFKSWLLTIAKHEALNFVTRVKNKQKTSSLDDETIGVIPSNDFSLGKYDDILTDNFDKETKTILILKIVFDFTYEEIAQQLNLSKSYAYRSYKLAFTKFKRLVEETLSWN